MNRVIQLLSSFLVVSVTLLCVFLAVPAGASTSSASTLNARTMLRSNSIASGYTLRNSAGTFQLGILPSAVTGVKKTRVKFSPVSSTSRFNFENETLYGDLYEYKIGKGKSKKVRLTKKVWLKMSYPAANVSDDKVMKYWNTRAQRWKKLRTADHPPQFQVTAGLRHKSAVIGVFAKRDQLSGEVGRGLASWYDGTGAASNDHPIGSTIRVTNVSSGAMVDTTVVSTGPFVSGRIVDLNREDFSQIANLSAGVVEVTVQLVE